ncbi:MAG: hypothetical protein MJ172_01900 [Clostridia bacterium]|nr:hypothetical protein [Clostridia bacterium]
MKALVKKTGSIIMSSVMLMGMSGCSEAGEAIEKEIEEVNKINSVEAASISDPDCGEWERFQNDFYAKHQDFYMNTMSSFLVEGKNTIYSPVNVYIALGMLTRCVEGESQEELLKLLGDDSVDAVKENIKFLFEYLSVDEGRYITTLANSIWLNSNVEFKEEVLEELGEDYYSSSFVGEMGTEALNEMFRDWLNDNTNNLLKNQVSNLELSEDIIMAIVSTIYYKVEWAEQFTEGLTCEEVFYGEEEVSCDFMHNSLSLILYTGENFEAVALPTLNGEVWYFLPNEGVSPEEVLNSKEMYDLIAGNTEGIEAQFAMVNCSIPKFDLESQIDLVSKLRDLGINSIFDNADFSPITDESLYVSDIIHGARLITDEEGVEAAAFTEILTKNACIEVGEILDFKCDRPFVTVVSEYNVPIFTGVVINPEG